MQLESFDWLSSHLYQPIYLGSITSRCSRNDHAVSGENQAYQDNMLGKIVSWSISRKKSARLINISWLSSFEKNITELAFVGYGMFIAVSIDVQYSHLIPQSELVE